MLHRITLLFTMVKGFILEYWPYAVSWAIITINWVNDIPEPVIKIILAIVTGFGLAFGKWCWEWVQKKFKL